MSTFEIELQDAKSVDQNDVKEFGITPNGYICSNNGVSIKGDKDAKKESVQITHKPIYVDALSRDGNQENWGVLLIWIDRDGKQHKLAVSAGRLHSKGNELAQELATLGLPIVPRREGALLTYLAAFHPRTRLTTATTVGWLKDTFVLPQQNINEKPESRIVYQPIEYHSSSESIYKRGTLDEWKTNVACNCESSLSRFGVCASLSAPLRDFAQIESNGFHSFGTTSSGKTTLLQADASVWGNGTDPAMAGGSNVYLQRWNATKNGLEGMAVSFNDLPFCIDEIGEGDAKDFGRIIYQLTSGTGKARATQTGAGRKKRNWRINILSAGETSIESHIREGGRTAKGGQLIRIIDIPANDIFPNKEVADKIKLNCGKYFGTAGPSFLNLIIRDGLDELRKEFSKLNQISEKIGVASTNETQRVRKRFGYIAFIGELAIQHSILPWQSGDALKACQDIYQSWLDNSSVVSDAARGIENVKAFILEHGRSRFETLNNLRTINNRAGWHRDNIYHFTPKAFEEACAGVIPITVKKELKQNGLLSISEVNRYTIKISVDNNKIRVVSVKALILEDSVPTVPSNKPVVGTVEILTKSIDSPTVPTVPTDNQQIENNSVSGGQE